MELQYPHLFEPIVLAGTVFRNRIFAAPQGFYHVGAQHLPGPEMAAFYERKALGGAASVCMGDCIVDIDTGRHYPFLCDMKDEETLPGLSAIASAISRHGAVASAELSHAGMFATDSQSRSGKLYGPVAMMSKNGPVEEMSEEMIRSILDSYAAAALWAKRCGFGMVTIHGGHGWLISQFFEPQLNTRRDQWGGSLENRLRFPLAVVDSVRAAVGRRFPIEFRMSGAECYPGGYDIDEGIRLAKALDGKVDLIHVSTGHHEQAHAMVITHPSMFLPDACNLKYAAAVKAEVSTPVATVGAFTTPEEMEDAIASGKADVVEIARQSLADPDLPIKARTGRGSEVRRCIRCMNCFRGEGEHRTPECTVNPEIGHELEYRALPAIKEKKRVLVVGGGPGGMEAALTAKRRGHDVILCEKAGILGGKLRCEKLVPFKQNTQAYLDYQAARLSAEGVEVRLNTVVTPEYARMLEPDVIIAAIGAEDAKLDLPGINGKNVFCADDIFLDPEKAGQRVVVLGGGLVGIELALFLRGFGKDVTLMEAMPKLTVNEFSMHTLALHDQFEQTNLKIMLSAKATAISEQAITVEYEGTTQDYPADTVIIAVGRTPLTAEACRLHDCAPEFYLLGDCTKIDDVQAATGIAHRIACDIGRALD